MVCFYVLSFEIIGIGGINHYVGQAQGCLGVQTMAASRTLTC